MHDVVRMLTQGVLRGTKKEGRQGLDVLARGRHVRTTHHHIFDFAETSCFVAFQYCTTPCPACPCAYAHAERSVVKVSKKQLLNFNFLPLAKISSYASTTVLPYVLRTPREFKRAPVEQRPRIVVVKRRHDDDKTFAEDLYGPLEAWTRNRQKSTV